MKITFVYCFKFGNNFVRDQGMNNVLTTMCEFGCILTYVFRKIYIKKIILFLLNSGIP